MKKILKSLKGKSGFTLVEMIIVMSMIMILTTLVFFNFRESRDNMALQRAVHRLAQDFRRAQSMSGLSYAGCSSPNYKYAYGIFFSDRTPKLPVENKKYILFSDCNANNNYDDGEENYKELGPVFLEEGVRIRFGGLVITGLGPSDPYRRIVVLYTPPDPLITIRDHDSAREGTGAIITLELERNPSKNRTVIINKAGMIDVN